MARQTQSHEVLNNKIMLFLNELSDLECFMIFLIRDEEEIDKRYEVHSKEELIKRICSCLLWTAPEGVLLIKN